MSFPGISCTFQIINKEEGCLLLPSGKNVGDSTSRKSQKGQLLFSRINPFITSHLVSDEPVSLASFDPTAVHQPKRDGFSCSLVSYAELLPIVGLAEWQLAGQDDTVH